MTADNSDNLSMIKKYKSAQLWILVTVSFLAGMWFVYGIFDNIVSKHIGLIDSVMVYSIVGIVMISFLVFIMISHRLDKLEASKN